MLVPNRNFSSPEYRYGFQGQEKDDEVKGSGNSINYKFRMHDPRVGRFFAVDPLSSKYPWYTPYSFSGNKVIAYRELEGLEEILFGVEFLEDFEPMIEVMTEDGTIEFIKVGVETSDSPLGAPEPWNPELTSAENFARWKKIGRVGHEAVENSESFEYENVNKQFGDSGRPDGWTWDRVNNLIRIAEAKGLTKTGLSKGLAQLTRYVLEAKKLCPGCNIEATLHFYRVFTGVYYDVREGDNLSAIAKDNNVSLEQLYELNPEIDRKTSLIKPSQTLLIDVKKKDKKIENVLNREAKKTEKAKDKTHVKSPRYF